MGSAKIGDLSLLKFEDLNECHELIKKLPTDMQEIPLHIQEILERNAHILSGGYSYSKKFKTSLYPF